MSIWAIVPVKPLKESKSRLATVLTPDEREQLSKQFLTHVIEVLGQVPEVERTLVISRDSAALGVARKAGANTVTESGAPELNDALTRAADIAGSFGAHAVLVLATDLPMLTLEDIGEIIKVGRDADSFVIAPDRHDEGTNAMLLHPPRLIQFSYGAGSFARHVALAHERTAKVTICRTPRLALDVDTPEDYALYQNGALATLIDHKQV